MNLVQDVAIPALWITLIGLSVLVVVAVWKLYRFQRNEGQWSNRTLTTPPSPGRFTNYSISIEHDLDGLMQRRVEEGNFDSVSTYISGLIRNDLNRNGRHARSA